MIRHRRVAPALLGVAFVLGAPPDGAAAQPQPFPYRLDTTRDIVLGVGGATLLAGAFAIERGQSGLSTDEIARLDPLDVNPFDRGATRQWDPTSGTASDVLVLTMLAAPGALLVTGRGAHEPLTVGVMYAEVLLLGNGLAGMVKGLAQRTRPYVYNDDPAITLQRKQSVSARRSFPSGHTTNAFAAAVFLSTVYGRLHPQSSARPWIWAGSLTAAATVGLLRYEAGKHFPTDILTGAALGAALGWVVPRLHESDRVRLSVVPTGDATALGASVSF